jgi:hypothetical protein
MCRDFIGHGGSGTGLGRLEFDGDSAHESTDVLWCHRCDPCKRSERARLGLLSGRERNVGLSHGEPVPLGIVRATQAKRFRALGMVVLVTMLVGACDRPPRDAHDDHKAPAAPIEAAKPAERGAVGDSDLRAMLAEIASAKACEFVRGQFRPLRAADRPEIVTGVMWIRDCKITNVDTKVTFALSGNGWQWADQKQHKAGGTFAVRQYVKFGMTATIPGALDIAYDRHDHVLSLWFTPAQLPEVTFTPVGGIDVDSKGAWSALIGALGATVAQSPEHMANEQAKVQGSHQLERQLADGLSFTFDLCTGLSRFGLEREPKGKMNKADAGESKRALIELQPGALMVFGPQSVGDAGFTAKVEAPAGVVHVALACRDQAETLAAAYAEGRPLPTIKTLAEKDILGKASLRVERASCQVSLIAQQLASNAGAITFDWERPPAEIARSAGGPLIACSPSAM